MNDKVMIAMSGGVDSSVAAYLSMEKYGASNTAGATMKLLGDYDPSDAQKVTATLGIPFHLFEMEDEFETKVIKPFIDSYKAGETPNPCIECNKYLKFDSFYAKSLALGYGKLATGHYARIEYSHKYERHVLKKAIDLTKDQSYVLYSLPASLLPNIYFPLGGMSKDQVREIASKQGFENANKKESQDICFVTDGNYSKFIEAHTDESFPEGDFVDLEGHVLGRHKGIIKYTIGQRRGLGLALPKPMYVCEKDVQENKVVLCLDDQLFGSTVIANKINLQAIDTIDKPIEVKAKIRYNQVEQTAIVEQIDHDKIKLQFEIPQRAIAKGQSVVMYDKDIVIGGGTII